MTMCLSAGRLGAAVACARQHQAMYLPPPLPAPRCPHGQVPTGTADTAPGAGTPEAGTWKDKQTWSHLL